jgi:hypothetical protein
LLKLSRRGEQLRWRLAALAMGVILFEVCFQKETSWGVYAALAACAAGYFMGDMVTVRGGGGYFLTPEEQATRRRFAIIPTLLLLYKGTDFRQTNFHIVVLCVALVIVTLLVLIPEPAE